MSAYDNNSESLSAVEESKKSDHDFLDNLLVLAKYKKNIILIPFVVAILSMLYSLTMTKIYTAKTMILAADDDSSGVMGAMMSRVGGLAGVAGASFGGPTKADLYLTMLRSEDLKDQIISRFKLMDVYKTKRRDLAYIRLDANTKAVAGKKDGVITISVSDKDPKRAADMANSYAEELGRFAASLNMTNSGKNRRFLEERLAATKIDLAKAEDEMKSFQAKNKAPDVSAQVKASIMGVAQLQRLLAEQEGLLAGLRRQFTDESQEVKAARTSVSALKAQIAKLEGKGDASSIPSMGAVPQLGQEYLRLMREFKLQEAMLEILTKQYEMAKFSEVKDISTIKIIQVAKPPEQRSKPSRKKFVLKMTFLSLFLTLSAVFAKEFIPNIPEKDRVRLKILLSNLPFGKRWQAFCS